MLNPCSGCGSRQCDGRCFMQCAGDYDESECVEEMLQLSPRVWEMIVMAAAALFIGFILVALP